MGHTDEDQVTDNEICTIASAEVDSGSRESANSSRKNKTAGLYSPLAKLHRHIYLCYQIS